MQPNLEKDISRMKKINRILLFLVLTPYLIGALTTLVSKKQLPNTVIYTDQTTGTNLTSSLSGSTRSVVLSETRGAFENLLLERATANTVTIKCTSITLNNTTTTDRYAFINVSETVDISASVGGGGPDRTGLDTASAWRSLWLIGKTDGTIDGLISNARDDINTSGGLMIPSGYTFWKRVGWARNDSSSNFVDFIQVDKTYKWRTDDNTGDDRLLSSGTQTTFTDVDCSKRAPVTARLLYLKGTVNNTGASQTTLTVRENGNATQNTRISCSPPVTPTQTMQVSLPIIINCDTSQIIDYKIGGNVGDSAHIDALGYLDAL